MFASSLELHGARGRRRAAQAGISLIELVMFIVIVSIGVVGILSVMNVTTKSSADPMIRKQALAIAESLLEEINLKDFSNPAGGFSGASTQANRPLFDDIGDYDGFVTTGIFPVDGGPAIVGLNAYSVSVTVAATAALSSIAATDAKLITVTVTGPGNTVVALDGYRTNYAQ